MLVLVVGAGGFVTYRLTRPMSCCSRKAHKAVQVEVEKVSLKPIGWKEWKRQAIDNHNARHPRMRIRHDDEHGIAMEAPKELGPSIPPEPSTDPCGCTYWEQLWSCGLDHQIPKDNNYNQ
jgi:hypothetical protein